MIFHLEFLRRFRGIFFILESKGMCELNMYVNGMLKKLQNKLPYF